MLWRVGKIDSIDINVALEYNTLMLEEKPLDLETMDEYVIDRFWHLYINHCDQHNQHPSVKDFFIWYEENYI